ncbi:hypothetical protein H4683_001031 [Filibacter limicola]|uniref:Transposase IS4-like domain-containing protein n=1 Tax=Sporosarcina limicola TaxID=34101 RepID=A0A927MHN7_9BACL|nr:hypothetical protein [Sporosarcina limicola]
MKQFSTISKLLSTLISPEELMELVEKHNYVDVARKFKVEDLLDFFVAAALEKWAGFRDGTEVMGVSAEDIADMYKVRWAIEYFFHRIKGYLNLPTLFGNFKNAVFTQLFIADSSRGMAK